jgi:hypothetical protein
LQAIVKVRHVVGILLEVLYTSVNLQLTKRTLELICWCSSLEFGFKKGVGQICADNNYYFYRPALELCAFCVINPCWCLQVRAEYRQIFLELGFTEMAANNYVESSFWNFDALFQPQQHPARDAHDTFFIADPATSNM